ncbi:hypothetical protein ABEI56_23240 [Peribacillus castrilensis]|uniref:hypothetical protein n=1 Tax=Peribacillus castrilensis TaxID=2897690 RepID=UPI003D290633
MSVYEITAHCFFPKFYLNEYEVIKRISINYSSKVCIEKKPYQPTIVPNRLLTPNEFKQVNEENEESQRIDIVKTFLANDYEKEQIGIMNSVEEIENVVSWISFLTSADNRIIKWGEIHTKPEESKTGSVKIKVGKKFNLPIDTSPIDESGHTLQVMKIEPQIVNENLEKYITKKPYKEINSALRWYRKGLLSFFPEEKLIFWVTALEIVSGLISEKAEIEDTCENCGNITIRRPSVNKKAIIDCIENLELSKRKTLDVIQKYRSKYAHGGNENFQYFDEKIVLVLNATHSLLILLFCEYFNKKEIIRYDNDLNHPIHGDLTKFKNDIRLLEKTKL